MAKVGLSKSYYAIYSYVEGTGITYSNGGLLGKAVDAEISLDNGDPVKFYADNGPAESANVFNGGTLTITNDRLAMVPVAAVLGLTTSALTEPASGTRLVFPADLNVPYVGYGTIRKDITDGTTSYQAIILYKVQFAVPNDSLATQGETVEFSGQEFTATIMRNDASPAVWKEIATFATEANADAYIRSVLSISST